MSPNWIFHKIYAIAAFAGAGPCRGTVLWLCVFLKFLLSFGDVRWSISKCQAVASAFAFKRSTVGINGAGLAHDGITEARRWVCGNALYQSPSLFMLGLWQERNNRKGWRPLAQLAKRGRRFTPALDETLPRENEEIYLLGTDCVPSTGVNSFS